MPRCAKYPHRARHVIGRGHQQPFLAVARMDAFLGKDGVFIGIARLASSKYHAGFPARRVGSRILWAVSASLIAVVDQRARAAGKHQHGVGIKPGQRRRLGQSLGGVVELRSGRAPRSMRSSSAPPSTMIPLGGARISLWRGKRSSSGRSSKAPRGEKPISANNVGRTIARRMPKEQREATASPRQGRSAKNAAARR